MIKKIKNLICTHTADKYAFTLAETMIVLIILGTIAITVIPSVINHHRESINRVKIKKAMAFYESAFKKIVVDNAIMTDSGFDKRIQPASNKCGKIKSLFKIVETKSECVFRSSEDVWWDVSDFKAPIVGLTEEDLSNASKKLYFSGHINNGVLRINDIGYLSGDEKANVQKTYNYINRRNN